jgi:hypothetical protein
MTWNKCKQRLLLICALSIIAVSTSFGQATVIILLFGDKVASEKLYLSVDGAMNISNLPGIDGSSAGIGVNYGLGVHIKLSDHWYFKPEFKPLSRKGAIKIEPLTPVSDDFTVDKTKLKINYIDFPLLFQYNINNKLWVAAGPQISFLTDANQYLFGTVPGNYETTVKVNAKSFFNKTNLSFPVEAGYCLKLATKKSTSSIKVNVFARYEYDFLEIFKDPAVGSTKISLFQVGLSLPFIKEKKD